jgi:hypothetical protein
MTRRGSDVRRDYDPCGCCAGDLAALAAVCVLLGAVSPWLLLAPLPALAALAHVRSRP